MEAVHPLLRIEMTDEQIDAIAGDNGWDTKDYLVMLDLRIFARAIECALLAVPVAQPTKAQEGIAPVAMPEPVARVTILTLADGVKAKVLRALSEKWIVGVPEGTKLYASPPTELLQRALDAKDAARYRWLRDHTGAGQSMPGSPVAFRLPTVPTQKGVNLMRGSVAQHLDAAIDAAIGIATKEQHHD